MAQLQRSHNLEGGQLYRGNIVRFWKWWVAFERVISKIDQLWSSGDRLIKGLSVDSIRATEMLQNCPVGTFLVRPSASAEGHLSVDYIDVDGTDKHTRIDGRGEGFRINLEHGASEPFETLNLLILLCQSFLYLLPGVPKRDAFTDEHQVPH